MANLANRLTNAVIYILLACLEPEVTAVAIPFYNASFGHLHQTREKCLPGRSPCTIQQPLNPDRKDSRFVWAGTRTLASGSKHEYVNPTKKWDLRCERRMFGNFSLRSSCRETTGPRLSVPCYSDRRRKGAAPEITYEIFACRVTHTSKLSVPQSTKTFAFLRTVPSSCQ